jgi:DnaJ family protein C protein 28
MVGMSNFGRSLDEEIRQAMRAGAFDNLPGKGKPLNLDDNPHEDPTWRLAYRMLRSGGHTLPWIEKRQAIEAELVSARQALERSWTWRNSTENELNAAVVQAEWERALAGFQAVIQELNKRIFDYNLEVPSDPFKRRSLNAAREIATITGALD